LAFASPVPVAGEPVRAQIRASAGGRLILDLAPYCSADPVNPDVLLLDVPSQATQQVTSSGYYDVWVGGERVAFGPVIVALAVSDLPGRVVTVASWTPTLVLGEPFERTIGVAGLLPVGESVSVSLPVVFEVFSAAGDVVYAAEGPPVVTFDPGSEEIVLMLPEYVSTVVGLGRYTYSLDVRNQLGERRRVLAGMLFVAEGGS
jgi:hypothetical protein